MGRARAVVCGGADAGGLPFDAAAPLRLDLWGADANVRLKPDAIRQELVSEPPPAFPDLLELAAYVSAADQSVSRGGRAAADLGAGWRRRFFVRVPVRRPDVWADARTLALLAAALAFLTDDEYRFDFAPRIGRGPSRQQVIPFGTTPHAGRVDEVALFSGGLDSLAGAAEAVVTRRRGVLLLNHRSSPKLAEPTARLVRALAARTGGPAPVFVPVTANRSALLTRDYTQRSRSLLFAALGATVATMLGLDRFRFYENGVVGLNLPVAPELVGAKASRTTHPRALARLSDLLTHLAGRPFAVENPFQWATKTEVVGRIVAAGCGDLIADARSCAHPWEASHAHPHCGRCSQCIDRRFAVLAAGAADHDPADRYARDLFADGWPNDETRTLLAGYVETANRVAEMTRGEFLSAYGEAFRAVRHFGGPADAAADRVFDLYRRHAAAVVGVVNEQIGRHADAIRRHALPADGLLRMVYDPGRPADPTVTAVAAAPPPAPANVFVRRGDFWEVRFAGGEPILLAHGLGVVYLHRLLGRPGATVSAAQLACEVRETVPTGRPTGGDEAIDRDAMSAYQARLTELAEEIKAATRDGDPGRADRLRAEFTAITSHVKAGTGKGGRPRRPGDELDRVRGAVGNALRRVRKDIRAYCPPLADHLHATLRCGRHLCYAPSDDTRWLA